MQIPLEQPLLDAAISALVATPPIGEDELIEIRGQLQRDASPETPSLIPLRRSRQKEREKQRVSANVARQKDDPERRHKEA